MNFCGNTATLKPMNTNLFWAKVDRLSNDECWLWTACKNNKGYGRYRPPKSGKEFLAHRYSVVISGRPLGAKDCVLHTCDRPLCVNPNHLVIGTHKDNSDDMKRKGRERKNPCRGMRNHNSRLSDEDVITIRKLYVEGQNLASLVERYGVDRRTVTLIYSGKTWRHLLGKDGSPTKEDLDNAKRHKPTAILSADQVVLIKEMLRDGVHPKTIGSQFGVHPGTIISIKRGQSWRDVCLSA